MDCNVYSVPEGYEIVKASDVGHYRFIGPDGRQSLAFKDPLVAIEKAWEDSQASTNDED